MTPFSMLVDLFGWLQSHFARVVVTAGSCALIYLLMVGLLRDKRKPEPTSPSSFFSLDELVSKRRFGAIGFFFAGSLALLYAALALNAGAALSDLQNVLANWLKHKFPHETQDQIEKVLKDDLPPWLEPLSVLALFLFFFAGKIRRVLVGYRDLILNASGLYKILDEAALDTARGMLNKNNGNFSTLEASLKKRFTEAPLPEQFAGNKGENRLAYQLIWLNRKSIRERGLIASLDQLRKAEGLPVYEHESLTLDAARLATASVVFVVLMGIYVLLAPLVHGLVPAHLNWPSPVAQNGETVWLDIIRNVVKYTLGFVLPLVLALNVYPIRRRAYWREESAIAAFAAVAVIQYVAAFVVFEVFNLIDAWIAAGIPQPNFSLAEAKLHIGAFLYSLVPIIALALFLKFRDLGASIAIAGAAISLAVGVCFGACDVVYEYYSTFDNFYWYQAVLGSTISLAFFVAGAVTDQFGLKKRKAA